LRQSFATSQPELTPRSSANERSADRTVTSVFPDVERSTRLLDEPLGAIRDGDALAELIDMPLE
jgi:hypothetical protein